MKRLLTILFGTAWLIFGIESGHHWAEAAVVLPTSAVTASSYEHPNGPENTRDGDLETRWSAEGDGEFIQFDLGQPHTLQAVNIAWFQGDQRRAFFSIDVSTDANNWHRVIHNEHSSGTTLALQNVSFTPTEARHVRIIGHGNEQNAWISITEVDIESPEGGEPISSVTASSYEHPNVPENTRDGDLGTRWSAEGDGEFIQFDLGQPRTLQAVNIAWFQGDQRRAFFSIDVSTDANNWHRVIHNEHSSGTTLALQNVSFTPTEARHVRIIGHGNEQNAWISITEVDIESLERGEPISSVTASSYEHPNVPENTRDGDLGTRWSAEGDGEFIQFDLGQPRILQAVNIAWFQGDQRRAFFSIDVSMDANNWRQVIYDGRSSGTTLALQNVSFTPTEARHVRIIGHGNEQNAWISITEVDFTTEYDPHIFVVDPRRALIETNTTVLEGFTMERILRKAAENAGLNQNADRHYRQMIDSYNRTVSTPGATACTGRLNGFSLRCDREEGRQLNNMGQWKATALVNRLDLAPENGDHCGQQRIILSSNEVARPMFVIFEAQIENPRRSQGLAGCRPVAEFWSGMSDIDDPHERRAQHLAAFLDGGAAGLADVGFGPFISANFLGLQGGQIRTNSFIDDPWTLREFRVRRDGNDMLIAPEPVTDSPHGVLWNDRDPLANVTVGPQCRASFLEAMAGLLTDNLARMSFVIDNSACWNAESQDDGTENYRTHLAQGTGAFHSQINTLIRGHDLTPENMADRARFAGSCFGCHQAATDQDLGRGVRSPLSLGFVHVHNFTEDCGDDSRDQCFAISPALKDVFLPHRKAVMEKFLSDFSSRTTMTQQPRPLGQVFPQTLGGQPMGTLH